MVDVIFFNNQEEFSDWLEENAEARPIKSGLNGSSKVRNLHKNMFGGHVLSS